LSTPGNAALLASLCCAVTARASAMLARFLQFIPTARGRTSVRVVRVVVTGMVMVTIVMMMMARESWHGDHDHHDKKQRQQHLFHGGIIARNGER